MDRQNNIDRLTEPRAFWDVLIIGGGATGLGAAVDAASRGLRTALVEQHDFAKGTSSRSTKLIHGGVRYLRQGNIRLVRESLAERTRLLRNAPGITRKLPFVVPSYSRIDTLFYGTGLKLYGWLSGSHDLGSTHLLSKSQVVERLPTIDPSRLRAGIEYIDGQFDDAGLAICLATTASRYGAAVGNYLQVVRLVHKSNKLCGVIIRDMETGQEFEISASAIINATGVFGDHLRRLDAANCPPLIRASQGAHIVLDRSFFPSDTALMIPKTDDGRVLFAIPWLGKVVVGTTDIATDQIELEPRATSDEVAFLLEHTDRYLIKTPTQQDILSVFAGLRPLVRQSGQYRTASLARDHTVSVSPSGLITITGGKWTTYRLMAKDAVDAALKVAGLPKHPCQTADLRLTQHFDSVASTILASIGSHACPLSDIEVRYLVNNAMCRTVEDVLARRSRWLLLDARRALTMAPNIAQVMMETLGRDIAWRDDQVASFRALATGYLTPTTI